MKNNKLSKIYLIFIFFVNCNRIYTNGKEILYESQLLKLSEYERSNQKKNF